MRGRWIVASVLAAAPLARATPTCPSIDPTLRADLQKAYEPSYSGCALSVVLPACAPSPSGSVVWEQGFGHSFGGPTLTITEAAPAGSTWALTRIELTPGASNATAWGGERVDGVRVLRTSVPAAKVDSGVAYARTAIEVKLFEKEPTGNGLGAGGWSSSGDFFAAVSVGGAARSFAGYESSDEQMAYLPVKIALAALERRVAKVTFAPSTYDAAARALFVARFHAHEKELDQELWWWVRERYVTAAGDAGDVTLVPRLVKWLSPAKGDASALRTQVQAVNAIAILTGDDRRFGTDGKPRGVAVVVKDYLAKPPK